MRPNYHHLAAVPQFDRTQWCPAVAAISLNVANPVIRCVLRQFLWVLCASTTCIEREIRNESKSLIFIVCMLKYPTRLSIKSILLKMAILIVYTRDKTIKTTQKSQGLQELIHLKILHIIVRICWYDSHVQEGRFPSQRRYARSPIEVVVTCHGRRVLISIVNLEYSGDLGV